MPDITGQETWFGATNTISFVNRTSIFRDSASTQVDCKGGVYNRSRPSFRLNPDSTQILKRFSILIIDSVFGLNPALSVTRKHTFSGHLPMFRSYVSIIMSIKPAPIKGPPLFQSILWPRPPLSRPDESFLILYPYWEVIWLYFEKVTAISVNRR